MKTPVSLLSFSLVAFLAAKGQSKLPQPPHFQDQTPLDYQTRMLNPKVDVREANLIVLAYATNWRYTGVEFLREGTQGEEPVKILETETTLAVLQVLKGVTTLKEIRFRQYGPSGCPATTKPQEHKMRERGIFVLRKQSGNVYRSAVDYYRTAFPTPWITESSEAKPCANGPDCVARVLIGFDQRDQADVFAEKLPASALLSQALVGYLRTFSFLNDLLGATDLQGVKRSVCIELSRLYALEFPEPCRALIAGTPAEEAYTHHSAELREKFKKGGLNWLEGRREFEPKGKAEVVRDLELIAKSSDPETRGLAETLLK